MSFSSLAFEIQQCYGDIVIRDANIADSYRIDDIVKKKTCRFCNK